MVVEQAGLARAVPIVSSVPLRYVVLGAIALTTAACAAAKYVAERAQADRDMAARIGACIALDMAAHHGFLDTEQIRRLEFALSHDYVPFDTTGPTSFARLSAACRARR